MLLPNQIDLTTLANVKNRAEVSGNGDNDEIQAAITGFSQWLVNWSGKTSLNSVASLAETYNGNGNLRLFLRSNPIVNVSSVTVGGIALPESGGPLAWGWFIESSKRSIAIRSGNNSVASFGYQSSRVNWAGGGGPRFAIGVGNVQVTYAAGFPPVTVENEIETITDQTITLDQSPWVADGGVVFYPSLAPLALVPNSPAAGEYAASNGLYVFNATDNTKQVAVTYEINQAPFDLEYATRCVVAINYKRKGWQDQESRTVSQQGTSATTRYQSWDFPREYWNVFQYYKRSTFI